MKQARAQLTPTAVAIGDRPLCISADPGTVVSAHMPDTEECQRYGLPPGTPILVITRPDGQQYISLGSLTAVVLGDPADPLPPDQVRDSALYVLGTIGEELSYVSTQLANLAAALRRSPGSVASLARHYRDEREQEEDCADAGQYDHTARAVAAVVSARPV
jgi:hypothetical protein